MIIESIELSRKARGDLINAVSPEKTAVEGRYPGVFLLYDLTIEIDETFIWHRIFLQSESTKKGRPEIMGAATWKIQYHPTSTHLTKKSPGGKPAS